MCNLIKFLWQTISRFMIKSHNQPFNPLDLIYTPIHISALNIPIYHLHEEELQMRMNPMPLLHPI